MNIFDSDDLRERLAAMTPAEIDALPFGVVKVNGAGIVTFFSQTEAMQSGMKKRPALGLSFFSEIAPCMDTPTMKGMIEQSWQSGDLDMEIGWVGDFADPDREFRIRAIAAGGGDLWLCLNRLDIHGASASAPSPAPGDGSSVGASDGAGE